MNNIKILSVFDGGNSNKIEYCCPIHFVVLCGFISENYSFCYDLYWIYYKNRHGGRWRTCYSIKLPQKTLKQKPEKWECVLINSIPKNGNNGAMI